MTPISAINTAREIQVSFLNDNIFSIRVRILAPPNADANTVAPCLQSNNVEAYSLERSDPIFTRTRSSQDMVVSEIWVDTGLFGGYGRTEGLVPRLKTPRKIELHKM